MKFKKDKGQAGLSIMLSVLVTLFIIGILIMIFSIMGSKLSDATYGDATATLTNQATTPTHAGALLTGANNYFQYSNCLISSVANGSADGTLITSGNYSVLSGCLLKNLTTEYSGYNWYINYTVDYKVQNAGTTAINDTANSIAGVTDWFDIFLTITAMVVLIFLTIIIIVSIKSSGMIGGDSQGNGSTIGTA